MINNNGERWIEIVAQGFYGNRNLTEVRIKNIDRFILGIYSDDIKLFDDEKIDRTIIKIPKHDNLVIIYNKYQEEKRMVLKKEYYDELGVVFKPVAIIPELGIELYSKCIACRIDDEGNFCDLEQEDYEIIFKYFCK